METVLTPHHIRERFKALKGSYLSLYEADEAWEAIEALEEYLILLVEKVDKIDAAQKKGEQEHMSAQTIKKYEEFRQWFKGNEHRLSIVDPEKRWAFMCKSIETLGFLCAMMVEDINELEGRKRNDDNETRRLFVPSGMNIRGDLTRLG